MKEVIVINLSPINITANIVSIKPGERLQINIDITVNETGRITIKNGAGVDPVPTNLEISVKEIALKNLSAVARVQEPCVDRCMDAILTHS